MGIDLKDHGRTRSNTATKLRARSPYIKLLYKLYSFLDRRQTVPAANISKLLMYPRRLKAPVSLSKIIKFKSDDNKKIAVVSTVTNDTRILEVPKMTIYAIKFTKTAREAIEKAGGKCLTLDNLAKHANFKDDVVVLRGSTGSRKVAKHFGAPGTKKSTAKPYVRSKGRKFERAKGHRKSRK